MSFDWNWVGVPGTLSGIATLALATVIYLLRPERAQNRYAALFLLVICYQMGVYGGIRAFMTDPGDAFATVVVFQMVAFLDPIAYFLLISTLPTPLAVPLRKRRVFAIPVVMSLVLAVAFLRDPFAWFPGVAPYSELPAWDPVFGSPALLYLLYMIGFRLYGIVAAITAYRRAIAPELKAQMGWYAAAFITFDSGVVLTIIRRFLVVGLGLEGYVVDATHFLALSLPTLVFAGLLGYGILSTQLFDINVRIKRSVGYGIAGVLVAAVYVVTAVFADAVLQDRATRFVAAGAIVVTLLAVMPLRRLGQRVADAAFPSIGSAPEELDRRKLEIYQASLEELLFGGGQLAPRESAMLEDMRERLGITQRDHAVLEHSLRNQLRTPLGSRELEPGTSLFGRYQVEDVLGRGGQGTAYLARDLELDRPVVIKLVGAATMSPDAALKEARSMARIDHARLVTIYDVERFGPEVALVMEYVRGRSLQARLEEGPVQGDQFVVLADDLLRGLGAVHDVGIVHRDVKPSNVLLDTEGRAKLSDMGLARLLEDETTMAGGLGYAQGTVRYMSPEQAKGHALSPQSDLFSAGATLYEAYTGEPYIERHKGESPVEVQIRAARRRSFDKDVHPAEMKAWFAKALAPEPADRFASAADMLRALPAAARLNQES